MIISLDYDGTYTKAPAFWEEFAKKTIACGHTVYCVTMRRDDEQERIPHEMPCKIIYTNRALKNQFCLNQNIRIDIWIDDMPYLIGNIPVIG